MRVLSLILIVTINLVVAICSSLSVTFTPHPGFANAPYYFSGTNARAHYEAEVSGLFDEITDAWLTIGGTTVWQLPPPDPGTIRWVIGVNPAVMFDSSHFAPGQSVEIKLYVCVNGGAPQSHSYSSTVKNYSGAWNHPDLSNGASVASGFLNSMSYSGSATTGASWSSHDYLSGLQNKTVFFVASHGNPSLHQAGNSDPVWSGEGGHTFSYENYRLTHIGTGLPPYNSTGQPALNFLHIYACNCGDTNNFVRGLIPYANAYGQWLEDQAVLAYNVYVPTGDADDHAEVVFQTLDDEYTLYAARLNLATTSGLNVWDDIGPPLPPSRDMEWDDIAIYGDQTMRLNSVYTGTNVAPIGWFRVL